MKGFKYERIQVWKVQIWFKSEGIQKLKGFKSEGIQNMKGFKSEEIKKPWGIQNCRNWRDPLSEMIQIFRDLN